VPIQYHAAIAKAVCVTLFTYCLSMMWFFFSVVNI